MNSRAQLFSVDFLFSVAIAVFAIGSIMNVAEIKGFSSMQEAEYKKLAAVGDLASDLLVTSQSHTCELKGKAPGNTDLGYLPNCFFNSANRKIDKVNLGLTVDYLCEIHLEDVEGYLYLAGDSGVDFPPGKVNDCTEDSTTANGSVYSVRRLIVFAKGGDNRLDKSELADCMASDPTCILVPYYVVLKVWKA